MESKQLEDICKNVDVIDEKIDIDNNLVDKGNNEKMMTEINTIFIFNIIIIIFIIIIAITFISHISHI